MVLHCGSVNSTLSCSLVNSTLTADRLFEAQNVMMESPVDAPKPTPAAKKESVS